jgi:predicted nucleic acid-binding protein
MIPAKALVLDANIMLRAVFGKRVRKLIESYGGTVSFCSPDVCFDEARKHISAIAERKQVPLSTALHVFDEVTCNIRLVEVGLYGQNEYAARERIISRDIKDWPVVATCLLLDCPVWTEDQDFFGSGISTWTTNNVEIYLRGK